MDLFIVTIKSLGSIVFLYILTKMVGRKQISQLNLFDYVFGISIGNVVAEMSINKEVMFWDGVVVMAVYCFVAILIAFLTTKSIFVRRWIGGNPIIILENGKILEKNLKKLKLDLNDILEEARLNGYFDLSEIEYAIMEANGKISFLVKSKYAPLTANDMKIKTTYKGLSANLIIDGKIMENNLKYINKDKKWLITRLNKLGYPNYENLLLVICDTNEKLTVYEKNIEQKKANCFE